MPEENEGAVLDGQSPDDGDGAATGDKSEADLYLDDIYFGDDDENPPESTADEKGEKKEAGDDAGKNAGKETPPVDVQQLMAEIEKLKSDKINLNKALHEERQQKKKAKTDDSGEGEELTEAQLRDLMKEHHDDPEALFNIVQYMSRQAAKREKTAAINESEISAKRKGLENLVSQRHPDFLDPESELRKQSDKVRGELNLEDHPYGDFLALGANTYLHLPEIMKEVYARGKEDALKQVEEANREKRIEGSKLTPAGSSKPSGGARLPKDVGTVAKQLGMTASQAKIYQRLVGNKSGIVTVEG